MRPSAERLLILGCGPLATLLLQEISERAVGRYALVGVVADAPPPELRELILGSMGDLHRILESVRPDRIIVTPTERDGLLPMRLLLDAKMQGICVESGERFYERISGKIAIESIDPGALVLDPKLRWPRAQGPLSRALSIAFAGGALFLVAPVLVIVAVAILIDSGAPVLFMQERVGLEGRPFRLLKFRTMRPASRRSSEWVGDNEDRITRVGRWLRRFRLDELPQLVNILRGDMKLVGPRPHPTSNFEMLATVARNVADSGTFPYYKLRTSVLPGITGWAQVRFGYANDIVQEVEKLRYDLYYVKHRSAMLDLRIVLETLRAVLRQGDGA